MSEEPLNITMARMSSGSAEQYMMIFTATRAVTLAYYTSKIMLPVSGHNNQVKQRFLDIAGNPAEPKRSAKRRSIKRRAIHE
jgi:hypothetical protein